MNKQKFSILFCFFWLHTAFGLKAFANSEKSAPSSVCENQFALSDSISWLGLPAEKENHLRAAGIQSLYDLISTPEDKLLALPGVNERVLAEINNLFLLFDLRTNYKEIKTLIKARQTSHILKEGSDSPKTEEEQKRPVPQSPGEAIAPDGKQRKAFRRAGPKRKQKTQVSDELRFLFFKLDKLRSHLAEKENISKHKIFSSKTLAEMAYSKPKNQAEMLKIEGVDSYKFDRYGKTFLKAIQFHSSKKP